MLTACYFPVVHHGYFSSVCNNAAILNEVKYSTVGETLMRVLSGRSAHTHCNNLSDCLIRGGRNLPRISEHSTLASGRGLLVSHVANSF
jgi:hypothetical protein